MKNKEVVKLGEYLYIKGRIGWKGLKKDEYLLDSDYRIINGESLSSDGIDWKKAGYISKERYDESPEIMLKINDILLSKDGTIGKIGYVKQLDKPSSVASGIFVIRNERPKEIDTKFIYYYLISPYFKSFITMRTEGSVIPHLYQKDFEELDFPLYDLVIQKRIVSILQSIDDKIELNNKINKNLEEQAYAIITSKILNINNKNMKTLDEFCNIFTGKKNANKSVINGKYKFFTCAPEVLNIDSFIYDGSAIIISGNGAYTGRTTFYKGKFDLYQRTYACTIKENVNCEYIYLLYWLVKSTLSKNISGGTHGSAIPYIVMDDIAKFEFSYDKNIFDNLSLILKSNLEKILNNNNENEKLIKLRDSLLPKLMSGEIDISKIDI